jgi:hypothetical protein
MNRINWNLRYDDPGSFNHSYEINANPGETNASPEGPLVLPGVYTVTLTVDGKAYKETVSVKNDPRSPASASELRAQHDLQMKLYDGAKEAWEAMRQATAMKATAADAVKANSAPDLATAATAFQEKLTAIAGASGGGGRRGFGGGGGGGFGGGGGGAPTAPTFSGVDGMMVRQLSTLDAGDMAPNEAMTKVSQVALTDYKVVAENWKTFNAKDLVAFNAILAKYNIKPIVAAIGSGISATMSGAPSSVFSRGSHLGGGK